MGPLTSKVHKLQFLHRCSQLSNKVKKPLEKPRYSLFSGLDSNRAALVQKEGLAPRAAPPIPHLHSYRPAVLSAVVLRGRRNENILKISSSVSYFSYCIARMPAFPTRVNSTETGQ